MSDKVTLLICFLFCSQIFNFVRGGEIVFSGEDLGTSSPSESGKRRTLAELPETLKAFAAFRSSIGDIGMENFDSFAVATAPVRISLGSQSAALSGGIILRPPRTDGHTNGQFAISGDQFLASTQILHLQLSKPTAAFGFFLTDVENDSWSVVLVGQGGERRTFSVPATVPNQKSGGCIFWGIVDRAKPFVKVELNPSGSEGYGVDDFIVELDSRDGVAPMTKINIYPGIEITGTPNSPYRIEVSQTPETGPWEPLDVLWLQSSPFLYFDKRPVSELGKRFYRVSPVE